MIRFVEVINKTDRDPRMERVATPQFELGEVWINEKYVVNVRPHQGYDTLLREGKIGLGLDQAHRFTTVVVNEGGRSTTHIVLGDPSEVATRLTNNRSQLLKG